MSRIIDTLQKCPLWKQEGIRVYENLLAPPEFLYISAYDPPPLGSKSMSEVAYLDYIILVGQTRNEYCREYGKKSGKIFDRGKLIMRDKIRRFLTAFLGDTLERPRLDSGPNRRDAKRIGDERLPKAIFTTGNGTRT